MGKIEDDKKMMEKIAQGEDLCNKICEQVHNGTIEEMYNYLISQGVRLELYGKDKKNQLINYCAFKRKLVLHMYS